MVTLAECPDLEALLSKFGTGPVAFDLETSGLDPMVPGAYIRSVSFYNDKYGVAIDLQGSGAKALAPLFSWLGQRPTIAHNWTFDAAWVERFYGPLQYEMCTKAAYMYLSNEGHLGQQWGLKAAEIDVLGWPESNEADLYDWLKANGLARGDMCQAPWGILGPYNFLDSAACWQLYEYFTTFYQKFPGLEEYIREDVACESMLLVEQQLAGVGVDVTHLTTYYTEMSAKIETALQEFLTYPSVAPAVREYNETCRQELRNKEPPKLKKDGGISVRWNNWAVNCDVALTTNYFNTDSPKHLSWLFYTKLKFPVARMTPSGKPSVDGKSLLEFKEPGKLLTAYRELRDEQKFVTAALDVQQDGVYYASYKVPATITGRLGGGG